MSEQDNHPPERPNAKGEAAREGDDRLNETCTASFEVPDYVSFHFKPIVPPGKDRSLIMHEYRNYRAGLTELAKRLDAARLGDAAFGRYASAKYVAVTSWIVENNQLILTSSGFVDDATMDPGERAELVRVYKERQGEDGVLPQHRAIEPKCLRVSVDAFIGKHLKRS